MNNLVDLEYYDKMYHIRKRLIIKHNISSFHLLDSLKNTIYTNDITCETHLVSCFNENYVFVIIGEQCMVVPKLCASRWGYLEAIINQPVHSVSISCRPKDLIQEIEVDMTGFVADRDVVDAK